MSFINPCFDQHGSDYPPPPPALGGQQINHPVAGTVIQVWLGGAPGHPAWLQAIIPPQALGQGTAPTQTVRQQIAPLGRQGDDAGHIIAANLGGPGNQLWNFFAQSPNFNRGAWMNQEQICANQLRYNQAVRLCFQFEYGDAALPNRVTRFQYCYKLGTAGTLVNDLMNP